MGQEIIGQQFRDGLVAGGVPMPVVLEGQPFPGLVLAGDERRPQINQFDMQRPGDGNQSLCLSLHIRQLVGQNDAGFGDCLLYTSDAADE